ncbi:hypothetical protein HK096_006260 [Nowakowskiella sp. JEL0078]|nr:hypothetical protein HK096_006260 [Nowakowskiella sp. JEL0078]
MPTSDIYVSRNRTITINTSETIYKKRDSRIPTPGIPGFKFAVPPADFLSTEVTSEMKDIAQKNHRNNQNIFSVFQELKKGKLPTNEQLLNWINHILDFDLTEREEEISSEGKEVIKDGEILLETLREVLLKKNGGMEFQKFLFHLRRAGSHPEKEIQQNTHSYAGSNEHFNDIIQDIIADFFIYGSKLIKERPLTKILRSSFEKSGISTKDSPINSELPSQQIEVDIEEKLKIVIPKYEETDDDYKSNIIQSAGTNTSARFGKPIGSNRTTSSASSFLSLKRKERTGTTTTTASTAQRIDNDEDRIDSEEIDATKPKASEQIKFSSSIFKKGFEKIKLDSRNKQKLENLVERFKLVVVEIQKNKEYQDAVEYFVGLFTNLTRYVSNEISLQSAKVVLHYDKTFNYLQVWFNKKKKSLVFED